jgi:hypothetical protein
LFFSMTSSEPPPPTKRREYHAKRRPSDRPPRFDRKQSPTGESPISESSKISNGSLIIPSLPEKLPTESLSVLEGVIAAFPAATGQQAWVPIIDTSSAPTPGSGSFFGGQNILMKAETEWPVCLSCRSPLAVVGQIDRFTLPHPLVGKGLVQIFACTACAKNSEKIKPKNTCWANVVYAKESNPAFTLKECPSSSPLPLRKIVKWLPRQDYMYPLEIEAKSSTALSATQWAVFGEAQVRSDKIGGYPGWLNGDESVHKTQCKICKANMRLLTQIDSCDNVPVEWGHDGCILVFECPTHTDIVTALMMSNL